MEDRNSSTYAMARAPSHHQPDAPGARPRAKPQPRAQQHPLATGSGPTPSRVPSRAGGAANTRPGSQSIRMRQAPSPNPANAPLFMPQHSHPQPADKPSTPSHPFTRQSLIPRLNSSMRASRASLQAQPQGPPPRTAHPYHTTDINSNPSLHHLRASGTLYPSTSGSRSGGRPTPPPSLASTGTLGSPRASKPSAGDLSTPATTQRPRQLSARRSNPLASSRIMQQHTQQQQQQQLLQQQQQLPRPPPPVPMPSPWQPDAGFVPFNPPPSAVSSIGGSLATSAWAVTRSGSASGARPAHPGMRGDVGGGAVPNACENDGRPATRGGGALYDLEGRPLTRNGSRPPSRMQLNAFAAATSGLNPPPRTSETAKPLSSTGPLTPAPRTYASVASSHSSIPPPPASSSSQGALSQTHSSKQWHQQHLLHSSLRRSIGSRPMQPQLQQQQQQQQQPSPDILKVDPPTEEDAERFADMLPSDDEESVGEKDLQQPGSWMNASGKGRRTGRPPARPGGVL